MCEQFHKYSIVVEMHIGKILGSLIVHFYNTLHYCNSGEFSTYEIGEQIIEIEKGKFVRVFDHTHPKIRPSLTTLRMDSLW